MFLLFFLFVSYVSHSYHVKISSVKTYFSSHRKIDEQNRQISVILAIVELQVRSIAGSSA